MQTDSFYRVSLKCLIRNEKGEVLVVKESGREFWDLPGGGIDHGEHLKMAIARELKEEVDFDGDFTFSVIAVEEPRLLMNRNIWQVRIIFAVTPSTHVFGVGEHADEIKFVNPIELKDSQLEPERKVYEYATLSPTVEL